MAVESKITIPKSQSKNSNCKVTTKWEQADEVILFTTQNGGALITDEIPGAGNVKQRVAIQEELIQNSKLLSTNSASAVTITSGSEISLLSHQSDEENHDAQEKPKKSRIPVRSNSSASSSSNNSIASHTRSYETPSGIPILKGSSLFKKEPLKDNKENWYKINEAESWILISPELLGLVKAEKLIKETDSRKANALTYRETDKVRLMDLTKKEILILKENLPRLCERLKGNEKINIFRN